MFSDLTLPISHRALMRACRPPVDAKSSNEATPHERSDLVPKAMERKPGSAGDAGYHIFLQVH